MFYRRLWDRHVAMSWKDRAVTLEPAQTHSREGTYQRARYPRQVQEKAVEQVCKIIVSTLAIR